MAKTRTDDRRTRTVGVYRLLAGQHQQADPDWRPPDFVARRGDGRFVYASGDTAGQLYIDPDTSRPLRAPTKTYKAGDLVPSEKDLVATFGANKFQKVGEREGVAFTPGDTAPATPGVFPHGQVSTGFQQAGPGSAARTADRPQARDTAGAAGGLAGAIPVEGVEAAGGQVPGRTGANATAGAGDGPTEEELDGMTVAELKQFAADEEIDLAGQHTKADMLRTIKRRHHGK